MNETIRYCQHNEHRGKEVPATTIIEVQSGGYAPITAYECDQHTPTVEEAIAHNERKGVTLTYMRVRDLSGNLVNSYQRGVFELMDTLTAAQDKGVDVWPVIIDVAGSFRLAMRNAGIDPEVIKSVMTTVADYTANHYGD